MSNWGEGTLTDTEITSTIIVYFKKAFIINSTDEVQVS